MRWLGAQDRTDVLLTIVTEAEILFSIESLPEAGLRAQALEAVEAMDDLLEAGVHILTLGQYLQPTRNHHPVIDWIHPDQFARYKQFGLDKGFRYVESGPLVRSSYHSEKHVLKGFGRNKWLDEKNN